VKISKKLILTWELHYSNSRIGYGVSNMIAEIVKKTT